MNLKDDEFTVLRFATDAIIGEPAKYKQILSKAEKKFPGSRPFKRAIAHLRKEMRTTPSFAELENIAAKLLQPSRPAGIRTKSSGVVKVSKIKKKLVKAAPKLVKPDETRHLAGAALKASLHSTNNYRYLGTSVPPSSATSP